MITNIQTERVKIDNPKFDRSFTSLLVPYIHNDDHDNCFYMGTIIGQVFRKECSPECIKGIIDGLRNSLGR